MLIITRRVSQSFIIVPNPGLDPATPIGELFQQGPIEVLVAQVNGTRVKLSIVADPRLLILREELCDKNP
jgi:sRNA-binding carbon storage regulator CsrA